MTGNWDPKRPVEGSWAAYLEFEDGTPATLAFSGYAHFDTAELTFWIAEGGYRDPNAYGASRRQLARFKTPEEEWAAKEAQGYGGTRQRAHSDDPDDVHPHYGLTLVSCEHGDMRQSPDGLLIYDDVSKREVQVAHWERGRAAELQELYQAVVQGRPAFHDGRWGQATLEVVLAIMQSARERKELYMSHQVPAPE